MLRTQRLEIPCRRGATSVVFLRVIHLALRRRHGAAREVTAAITRNHCVPLGLSGLVGIHLRIREQLQGGHLLEQLVRGIVRQLSLLGRPRLLLEPVGINVKHHLCVGVPCHQLNQSVCVGNAALLRHLGDRAHDLVVAVIF